MGKEPTPASRVSMLVLLVIFVVLAAAVAALILAYQAHIYGNDFAATYLALLGILALAMSAYVLLQTRRTMMKLRIEIPPVTTTIECRKCGFKVVREFQRGDYVFKEVEPCQKCNEKMLITAIYREVRERKSEIFPF